MTLAELLSATARAKCVMCLLRIAVSDDAHHFRGSATFLQQLGHHRHRRARVHEEQFKPLAEIVLSRLAIARDTKPVLRATTVAKVSNSAVLALLREQIAFVIAKLALLWRCHHLQKGALVNIAEQVFRLDEMIAGIKVAVVLQCRAVSAGWSVDAQQVAAEESFERHIEQLNKHFAHVMPNPLLENVHEELAVLPAADCSVRYHVAGLRVEDALAARLLAPAQVRDIDRVCAGALDDRDELHPLCPHLVAEETVNRASVLLVGGVDRTKDVEVDIVLAKVAPAFHHLVKCSLLPAIEPVGVMNLAWTVAAEADKEIVFLEKCAPLVIKQDTVGLECVLNGLSRPAILLYQFNGAPEELDLHQCGLAALPGDRDRGCPVGLQELFDVGFECFL